jgi:hypothetical protein
MLEYQEKLFPTTTPEGRSEEAAHLTRKLWRSIKDLNVKTRRFIFMPIANEELTRGKV